MWEIAEAEGTWHRRRYRWPHCRCDWVGINVSVQKIRIRRKMDGCNRQETCKYLAFRANLTSGGMWPPVRRPHTTISRHTLITYVDTISTGCSFRSSNELIDLCKTYTGLTLRRVMDYDTNQVISCWLSPLQMKPYTWMLQTQIILLTIQIVLWFTHFRTYRDEWHS